MEVLPVPSGDGFEVEYSINFLGLDVVGTGTRGGSRDFKWGEGGHLKQSHRAEGGAKIYGVFQGGGCFLEWATGCERRELQPSLDIFGYPEVS